MGGSRVLPLAKAFVAHVSKAVRLFSCGLPQPENGAYLSPFSSLPTPVIDHDLQYDRYSEAVRQLRPLFPPTCTFLEPDDVAVVGDVPIGAGSFADIWEGTANGRRILLKSYRRHEYCDIERLFRVRNELSSHTAACSNTVSEIPRRGVGVHPAFPPERYSMCWS